MENPFESLKSSASEHGVADRGSLSVAEAVADERRLEAGTPRGKRWLQALTIVSAIAFGAAAERQARAEEETSKAQQPAAQHIETKTEAAGLSKKVDALLTRVQTEAGQIASAEAADAFARKFVQEFQNDFELPFVNGNGQPFTFVETPPYTAADGSEISKVAGELRDIFQQVRNKFPFENAWIYAQCFNRVAEMWQRAPAYAPRPDRNVMQKAGAEATTVPTEGRSAEKPETKPDTRTASSLWARQLIEKARADLTGGKVKTKDDAEWLLRTYYGQFVNEFYFPSQGMNLRVSTVRKELKERDYTDGDLLEIAAQAKEMKKLLTEVNDQFHPFTDAVLANEERQLDDVIAKTEYWYSYAHQKQKELLDQWEKSHGK